VRETEVLAGLEQGLSNKAIAWRLGIEQATVKNHVHSVLEKLNIRRRSEAAARAHARPPAEVRAPSPRAG
jgi:DNA-binding NarL/FixJ family response regulator